MNEQDISLELLTDDNIAEVRAIQREDISEGFVDTADTIMELTRYGIEHGCLGHTYVIRYKTSCAGVILLGEAIPWETDPEEMKQTPFYRLMGFVIDKRYRSLGIGGYALEKVIEHCYSEFGVRPIALGCHRDNHRAADFYSRHGFRKTEVMEGDDYYYLRYPTTGSQEQEVLSTPKSHLLQNLYKLHTTDLGVIRIKKNLSLTDDPVQWCRTFIASPGAEITRQGKNFYITHQNVTVTVNAHSYTVITAHKNK